MPFAFYDLETTGRSPAFDHPLQFAAILTDDDLQPMEEVNLRCRLAAHVLPSPGAIAVTGISLDQLTDPKLPTWYELSGQISDFIERWAPATWTGYNTIKFDESFLRQSFYQCLQPQIYATQFNGNTRLDVMQLVYAVRVFAPDTLSWPTGENGKISFKLDQLAPANGFTEHNAHDALGDVRATIHLLRLIRDRAPAVWAEYYENRSKAHAGDLLSSNIPVSLVQRFGGEPYEITGTGCGFSASNPNLACFFDLRAEDPAEYLSADDDTIFSLITRSPKVVRGVKVNATPPLFRSREMNEEIQRRADVIADHPEFQQRMGQAMARFYAEAYPEPEPGADVKIEDRIYDGFYSNADKALLEEFHRTDWPDRIGLISRFEDERLRILAHRLILLDRPGLLSPETRHQAAENILAKWHATDVPRNGWTTFDSAGLETAELVSQGKISGGQANALADFYQSRRVLIERL